MFKRFLAVTGSFVGAVVSSVGMVLAWVLDNAGRADLISNLGQPNSIAAKALAWVLHNPSAPTIVATGLVCLWCWLCHRLLSDRGKSAISPALSRPDDAPVMVIHHTAGAGGAAYVTGDQAYARGGDGGNAPEGSGRGARRSRSGIEVSNGPTESWPFGGGGSGANTPEYNRRLMILSAVRRQYVTVFPGDEPFIAAGIDPVPVNWTNKRLEELGETWRVRLEAGGYVME